MSIMFRKPIPGYKTAIIGDRQGNPHKVQVPITIQKAKAFEVVCEAHDGGIDYPAVPFRMDGENGTSKSRAMEVAVARYRHVMLLRPCVHVHVTVREIKAKVGTSAHAR